MPMSEELLVHRREVRLGPQRLCLPSWWLRWGEYGGFDSRLIPVRGQRPGQTRCFGALQILVDGAHPDCTTPPDLLVAQM